MQGFHAPGNPGFDLDGNDTVSMLDDIIDFSAVFMKIIPIGGQQVIMSNTRKGGSRLTPPLLFFLQIGGTAEAGAPSFRRKPEHRHSGESRNPEK